MRSSHNIFKKKETEFLSSEKRIITKHTPKIKIPKDYSLGIDFNIDDNELDQQYRKSIAKMNQEIKEKKRILEQDLEKLHIIQTNELKRELEGKRQNFIDKIEIDRKKMFKEVADDIELLKKKSEDKGFETGLQNGFKEGYEQGYQESIEETKSIRIQASTLLDKANKAVTDYQVEKKEEIIELIIQIAENIVHREIDKSDEKLYVLLEPILSRMNKMDNFITIFVGKENVENIKKHLDILKNKYPEMKYTVLIDDTLEKNGCWIETDFEVLNLEIRKQLESIKQECLNLEAN